MVFDGLCRGFCAVSVSHKPPLDLGVFRSIFWNFGEFRTPASPLEPESAPASWSPLEPAQATQIEIRSPRKFWRAHARARGGVTQPEQARKRKLLSSHGVDTARASSKMPSWESPFGAFTYFFLHSIILCRQIWNSLHAFWRKSLAYEGSKSLDRFVKVAFSLVPKSYKNPTS